ncbi:MAG: TldD/PmbA family protein [Acidilobaceae archaeon]
MIYDDIAERAMKLASSLGARETILRVHRTEYEILSFDGGHLKEHSFSISSGLAIEVYTEKGRGLAYTSSLDWRSVSEAVRSAIESTISSGQRSLAEAEPQNIAYRSRVVEDPFEVDATEKISLIKELNREALKIAGVVSATTNLGIERDYVFVARPDGTKSWKEVVLIGISHSAIAKSEGVAEKVKVRDSRSFEGGWEKAREFNWIEFVSEVTETAVRASRAKMPPAGVYEAVVDNKLVGTVIHEALGHAAEGDLVVANASVLTGRLGEKIASDHVSVIDEGIVDGGYPVPFDEEGMAKRRIAIIEKGVLKSYLTSRSVAASLGLVPTGNARASGFRVPPIVRQANFYIAPGDYRLEELFEGLDGIYLRGVGGGGQVDPATGTFTFNAGPSYLVKKGKIVELVRGVLVSGRILDFLSKVKAIGRDLVIETSVFGGCGKDGQIVRVGLGGPHLRVEGVIVGGR